MKKLITAILVGLICAGLCAWPTKSFGQIPQTAKRVYSGLVTVGGTNMVLFTNTAPAPVGARLLTVQSGALTLVNMTPGSTVHCNVNPNNTAATANYVDKVVLSDRLPAMELGVFGATKCQCISGSSTDVYWIIEAFN